MKKTLFSIIINFVFFSAFAQNINLAGNWLVKLDSSNVGVNEGWLNKSFGNQFVTLPGTLDDAQIGTKPNIDTINLQKSALLSLTRKHRYVGVAWYQKEVTIKNNFDNAQIFLERVIWKTDCWIDGKFLGSQESLSAPQKFETGKLKAGKHTIVLKIDNSKKYDISFNDFAHAYTDGTQIIWNGVIGGMKLIPSSDINLNNIQVFANLDQKSVSVDLDVNGLNVGNNGCQIKYEIFNQGKLLTSKIKPFKIIGEVSTLKEELILKEAQQWDEFNPNIYSLVVSVLGKKNKIITKKQSNFGFRKLGNSNGLLCLNGKRIFLRGTLDCNVYPLEGHPPMEKDGWIKVLKAAKNYGLNHIRYHSWCPPEAAFEVADSLGLYLQVELPLWELNIGKDKPTLEFLKSEAQNIISNYGNHPSFCFFSMGNELQGDFNWLNTLVADLKKQDNRRFYAATTFTFEKGHGRSPEPNDDFFITQYTKKGWVRGQGVFNSDKPNFITDYSKAVEDIQVPLITHEIGQYSVFPNLDEIKKYTGVLEPLNFKAIRYDLLKKNLLSLADSFKLASGKFAVNLYKEEIERALKTNKISGFQLLDLHDFPGQGTALVGLLDAFWDSKGLIKPDNFREFCAPVVPLLRFQKASYLNNESFNATIQVANFSNESLAAAIRYEVTTSSGLIVFSDSLGKKSIDFGSNTLGDINLDLSKIKNPESLNIKISIPHTVYQNQWTIWVYPAKQDDISNKVIFTNSKTEAFAALKLGKTVLLNPDTSKINGVDGRFTSVFWSPVHFPNQPGTMGILCIPKHPAFASFPTEFYSNWQWWDLTTNSKTMIIDSLPQIQYPIVRVVDNFFKNRKMASIIEAKVGNGKLILCSMDISNDLEKRIEAKQLKYSLLQYAESQKFNPEIQISEDQLSKILK